MISILQKEEKINENDKKSDNVVKDERIENKETSLKMHKKSKNHLLILLILFLILILIITGFSIFTIIIGKSNKIISGVKIDDINLSNITVLEAKNKINDYIDKKMNINFMLNDNNIEKSVSPEEIGIKINTEKILNQAYNYGRNNNFFSNSLDIINSAILGKQIELKIEFDDDIFNKFISELNIGIENPVRQPVYYTEGTDLIINIGKQGNAVNEELFKQEIIKMLKQNGFDDQKIDIPLESVKPEDIDIDNIYNKIHKEPQNAYISKDPFEFHAHSEGIDFAISIDEAKKMVKEEKDQYIIPLKIIMPEITNDKIGDEAFPDQLSSFSTNFSTADWNRTENIKLSVTKVNGTVLMPGEEFSYNDTIGPTTKEAGYKPGAAYIAGKVVTDYGGGVCQTSSTIYNAVLFANLDVTSRTSHYYSVGYVPVGRDATVYSPSLDFKFKNNRNYPIKIKAEVYDGTILVEIFGVKEESDYEVELESFIVSYLPIKIEYEDDNTLNKGTEVIKQSGSNGFKTETYKILKKDGETVSRSLISTDYYSGYARIIRRGTKE